MRSEFASLLSHLHRSFDSPPRGAIEAGAVSVIAFLLLHVYMYTKMSSGFALCMYLHVVCIHV